MRRGRCTTAGTTGSKTRANGHETTLRRSVTRRAPLLVHCTGERASAPGRRGEPPLGDLPEKRIAVKPQKLGGFMLVPHHAVEHALDQVPLEPLDRETERARGCLAVARVALAEDHVHGQVLDLDQRTRHQRYRALDDVL